MINAEGDCLSDKDFDLSTEDTSAYMACLPTEKMWKLFLEKKMKIENISHFKQKWGEHMLRELIKKAFSRTKSQKEAGRLLGCYTSADEDPKKYSTFRQECTKMGLKIKDYK